MSSERDPVYLIRDRGADGWVSPEPAADIITETVIEATDLEADDIDALGAYVDTDLLRAVVAGETDGPMTFAVEGHRVTVTADGAVDIDR